MMMKDAKNIFF